jgi:hypothetical protein
VLRVKLGVTQAVALTQDWKASGASASSKNARTPGVPHPEFDSISASGDGPDYGLGSR